MTRMYYDVTAAMRQQPDLFPSVNSYMAFQFLVERTLRFNDKCKETIYIHHVLEGVYTRDGECVQGPCGLKRRVWIESLKVLETIGFIKRSYDRASRLIVEVLPAKVIKAMSMLKVSKKRTVSNNMEGVQIPHTPCADSAHIRKEPLSKGKNKIKTTSASSRQRMKLVVEENEIDCNEPASTLAESLDKARQRNEQRVAKNSNGIASRPTKKNMQAYWRSSIAKNHSTAYRENMSTADWGSFVKSQDALPAEQLPDMIDWCIKNWTRSLYSEYSWTLQYKTISIHKAPSLAFFCRHFAKLVKSFTEQRLLVPISTTAEGRRQSVAAQQTIEHLHRKLAMTKEEKLTEEHRTFRDVERAHYAEQDAKRTKRTATRRNVDSTGWDNMPDPTPLRRSDP